MTSESRATAAPSAGAADRTTWLLAGLAYLGGGASAVYLPLGVVGVPLALLSGGIAVHRAGERRLWPPVGLAVLGGFFSLLWFALMLQENGMLLADLCSAACVD